jgi:hypothetical protein
VVEEAGGKVEMDRGGDTVQEHSRERSGSNWEVAMGVALEGERGGGRREKGNVLMTTKTCCYSFT